MRTTGLTAGPSKNLWVLSAATRCLKSSWCGLGFVGRATAEPFRQSARRSNPPRKQSQNAPPPPPPSPPAPLKRQPQPSPLHPKLRTRNPPPKKKTRNCSLQAEPEKNPGEAQGLRSRLRCLQRRPLSWLLKTQGQRVLFSSLM